MSNSVFLHIQTILTVLALQIGFVLFLLHSFSGRKISGPRDTETTSTLIN